MHLGQTGGSANREYRVADALKSAERVRAFRYPVSIKLNPIG